MARHRCTRCKEDVGEYGIRHKYAQGLFCEKCLSELRVRHRRDTGRGFWGRLWDRVREFVVTPFVPKPVVKESATKVAYSVMKTKARDILPDARAVSP